MEPALRTGWDLRHRDAAAGVAFVLFCVALLLSSLTTFRFAGFTLGDFLLVGSLAFTIVSRFQRQAPLRVSSSSFWIAILLSIGGLLASLNADSIGGSLTVLARLLLVALILPWQGAYLIENWSRLRTSLGFFAAGGAICGAGTLIQAVLGPNVIPGTEVTNAARFPGFAQHVSDTGGITAVALVLSITLLVSAKGTLAHGFYALCILGSTIGLVLSGSVSGLVAAAIGLLVLVLWGNLRARYLLLLAALTYVVAVVATAIQSTTGALDPFARFQQTLGQSEQGRYATADSRFNTYVEAVESFVSRPFSGAGLDLASSYVNGGFPAHNILIASAYQGGVFVAIGLIAAFLRPFRGQWVLQTRRTAVAQSLAIVAVAAIFAMTAPSMYNRYFWLPVMFLFVARKLWTRSKAIPGESHLN